MQRLHPERSKQQIESGGHRNGHQRHRSQVETRVEAEELVGQRQVQHRDRPKRVPVERLDGAEKALLRGVFEGDRKRPVVVVEASVGDVGAEHRRGQERQQARAREQLLQRDAGSGEAQRQR
jgi:hypothetical protein